MGNCCSVSAEQYHPDASQAAASMPAPSAASERAAPVKMSVHTATIARARVPAPPNTSNAPSFVDVEADASAVEYELDRRTKRGYRVTAVLNLYRPTSSRPLEYMLHKMHVEATETGSVHGNNDVLHQLAELSTDGWWLCGIIDTTERKRGASGGVQTTLLMALQREVDGERISRVYEAGSQPMVITNKRGGKEVHVPTLEGYLENKLNNGLRVCGIYRDPLDQELRFLFERINPETHELRLCAFQLTYTREKENGETYWRYEHSSYARVATACAKMGWNVVGALALPDRSARLICVGPQLTYRHQSQRELHTKDTAA